MFVKNSRNVLIILSTILSALMLIQCKAPVEQNSDSNTTEQEITESTILDLPEEDVSEDELNGLIFMREEEKLARDSYQILYNSWSQRIFSNISESEQKHMDAILILLNKYELPDTVQNDTIGVFQNDELQQLFSTLMELGSSSLIEALKVGALIEETDILDIQFELDEHVDNQDIIIVYENLLRGSGNHLRAFVRNLSKQGISYDPQLLSEDQYRDIINGE